MGMLLLVLPCQPAFTQPYKAIHYRWEQGFNANAGYGFFHDKKGYIWISTENGLMRFNGREFKLYTTRDGLPDNEVFNLTEDDEGRIWLLPFAKNICYIKHDKIFDKRNDPFLSKLEPATHYWHRIYFGKGGTIYLAYPSRIAIFSPGRGVRYCNTTDGRETVWQNARKELMLLSSSRDIYRWKDTGFVSAGRLPPGIGPKLHFDTAIAYDGKAGKIYHQNYSAEGNIIFQLVAETQPIEHVYGMAETKEGELLISSDHGAYLIDIRTGKVKGNFLANYHINGAVKTKDGTLWLGTAGGGIFRLLNTKVKSLPLGEALSSIRYIKGTDKGMHALAEPSTFIRASTNSQGKYALNCQRIKAKDQASPYIYAAQNRSKELLACGPGVWASLPSGFNETKPVLTNTICKTAIDEDARHLLTGTISGIFRIDKDKLRVLETFMPGQRVSCLAKVGDTIYAGTLEGLFACYPDKSYRRVLAHDPRLDRHIMALCKDSSGTLWIACNNASIIGLRHNRILTTIGLDKGLQCNRISCVEASGQWIWIGTDNGLFAIEQKPPYSIVKHLTYATGLNSNQVNCLAICNQRIWVGGIKGINYFDEGDLLSEQKKINIIINSMSNGDQPLTPSDHVIELYDKPLGIDFDVIDFSSSSRIFFEYKVGDSGPWIRLENNHLYFPTLPYGHFSLAIRAFGPNWPSGTHFRQAFYNPPPFYRRWWFLLLAGLMLLVLTGATLLFFVRRIKAKYREKLGVQQNLLRLEQMALQGQMNPHFIFNCIAAIKQYYSSGNMEKAQSFVDSFALLIRQTFEMGTEAFISLDKELSYLSQYLHVEQARFNYSFSYEVVKEPLVNAERILIPTMLLQPLVENAVRHGVRHLAPGQGMIRIRVRQLGGQVEIRISDNGIGRQRSHALKSRSPGTPLTSTTISNRRVDLLNRLLDGKLIMHIKDLYDDREASGTEVLITYPINIPDLIKHESDHH